MKLNERYISKLAAGMKDAGMDAVLICPSEELRFFTGFDPQFCERFQGLFVTADGGLFYVCNLLYEGEAKSFFGAEVPVYSWFDGDVMTDVVGGILKERGLVGKAVGVNSSAQAFNVLELADKVDITFKNAKPLLEEIRVRKTGGEMDGLRRAAAMDDGLFTEVLDFMKEGMKEQDVRDFFTRRMKELGGTNIWNIVASGPNAGYPHYNSGERTLRRGDAVVLDFGCALDGLCCDMTRTVFMGEASDEYRRLYGYVDEANHAAEDAVHEGAFIPDIDRAAREVLAKYGYAETLVNRVGHGIGYMVHEAPDIKKSNPRRLERGMAFSIEPGIYLPGRVGIRIEDIVMINEKGEREILNKASRDIFVV